MTPWCSRCRPCRGPMSSRPPSPNRPASKEIIAPRRTGSGRRAWPGSVTPSRTSPLAVANRPSHWRRPTWNPNMRSAITAMKTTPAARATWTTDIGASVSAATCRPQLAVAISIPSANHFEEYSCAGRAQRVSDHDLGHLVGAAVLVEEPEVRHEGAREGQEYAEIKVHGGKAVGGSDPSTGVRLVALLPWGRLGGSTVCRQSTESNLYAAKEPSASAGPPGAAARTRTSDPARGSRRAASRPLLMVDIDGVISLFGGSIGVAAGRGHAAPEGSFHSIEGMPHFLSSEAAAHLQELASASSWSGRAAGRSGPTSTCRTCWACPRGALAELLARLGGRAPHQSPLEARGNRRLRGHTRAGLGRRRARSAPAGTGPATAPRPPCSCRPTPRSGSPASRPGCWPRGPAGSSTARATRRAPSAARARAPSRPPAATPARRGGGAPWPSVTLRTGSRRPRRPARRVSRARPAPRRSRGRCRLRRSSPATRGRRRTPGRSRR